MKVFLFYCIVFSVLSFCQARAQNYAKKDLIPSGDSTVQQFMEEEILKRINEYRIAKGVSPLRADTILATAAYHHLEYMRRSGEFDHEEKTDLPDFNELPWPSYRRKLLDQNKIWAITEELLSYLIMFNSPTFTFEYMIEHTTTNGFKTCSAHWRALMNPEYDCAFVVYDMKSTTDMSAGVICMIILGMSSDPYKKELGLIE